MAEQNNLILDLDEMSLTSTSEEDTNSNEGEDIVNWYYIKESMREYYNELAKLTKEMKEFVNDDTMESLVKHKKLGCDYTFFLRQASCELEKLLKEWNGEDIVDIVDYIFEKFYLSRVGIDENSDDYLNIPNQKNCSFPPLELLKRVYDEMVKRYPSIYTKCTPEQMNGYVDFISHIYVYLPNEEYIEHFLSSTMKGDYDYLFFIETYKNVKTYQHARIEILSSQSNNNPHVVKMLSEELFDLYTIFRLSWCVELHYLRFRQYQIQRGFHLTVRRMTQFEKQQSHREWFEDGISWLFNVRLDEIQSEINSFMDDIERANVIFDDEAIQKIVGIPKLEKTKRYMHSSIDAIKKEQLELSREINKECFNVNFSWVKKQIMKDYEEFNKIFT